MFSQYSYTRPRNLIDVTGSDLISPTPNDDTFWEMYIQLWSLPSTTYKWVYYARKCCSLLTICEDIVQCKKTEAAGTIVYASDHKKMRVYPVSTLSRISLLNLTKLGIKLFWGLFVSPYRNEI